MITGMSRTEELENLLETGADLLEEVTTYVEDPDLQLLVVTFLDRVDATLGDRGWEEE